MPTNKQTKKISVDPFKLFTNNLWSPGELKTIVAKVKQAQAKQKKKPKKLVKKKPQVQTNKVDLVKDCRYRWVLLSDNVGPARLAVVCSLTKSNGMKVLTFDTGEPSVEYVTPRNIIRRGPVFTFKNFTSKCGVQI